MTYCLFLQQMQETADDRIFSIFNFRYKFLKGYGETSFKKFPQKIINSFP